MPILSEQFPSYVGGEAFKLDVSEASQNPTAGDTVVIDVTYPNAEVDEGSGEGPVLPLEYRVFAPNGSTVRAIVFEKVIPSSLEFEATAGPGSYMVRLGELFHNRWWGAIVVSVAGELEVE